MPDQEPQSVQTAYGPVNVVALPILEASFDTRTILRAVERLDAMRVRLCWDPEGLREDLLRLHSMAHTVIHGTTVSASAVGTPLADQVDNVTEELKNYLLVLQAILDTVRPLASLRVGENPI